MHPVKLIRNFYIWWFILIFGMMPLFQGPLALEPSQNWLKNLQSFIVIMWGIGVLAGFQLVIAKILPKNSFIAQRIMATQSLTRYTPFVCVVVVGIAIGVLRTWI